jgi:hypothetical protein
VSHRQVERRSWNERDRVAQARAEAKEWKHRYEAYKKKVEAQERYDPSFDPKSRHFMDGVESRGWA